jgi:hypothetical protein
MGVYLSWGSDEVHFFVWDVFDWHAILGGKFACLSFWPDLLMQQEIGFFLFNNIGQV